jgi:hypothetical protein
MFDIAIIKDGYGEVTEIGRTRAVNIRLYGYKVLRVENGVGQCCGATFLCDFSSTRFVDNFEAVLALLRTKVNQKLHPDLWWALQDKVFLYLSDETDDWDSEIRKHPKMSLVYSFNNKATKPYSGSMVHLYVLDLS